jgi:hypothetical protein
MKHAEKLAAILVFNNIFVKFKMLIIMHAKRKVNKYKHTYLRNTH